MKAYQYLIIGGGMTADAAVSGIRDLDKDGTICLISAEKDPPYNRTHLSKGLWNSTPAEEIWLNTKLNGAELKLGLCAVNIDPAQKLVEDSRGGQYRYEKLLIATGVKPKKLPFENENILYYHDYADYEKLKIWVQKKNRFAVIGSGFVGSEISAALAMQGKEVLLFDLGPGIGWNIFAPEMVYFLNGYYRNKGVEIHQNADIQDISERDGKVNIVLKGGEEFLVEGVVAGVGAEPQVYIARNAGITVDNGIKANAYLETNIPDIFAAGDVAYFYSPALDKCLRVEHEDNALKMGYMAGRNMAGDEQEYDYLPMFYSDLFDLGYEAVGVLDSRLDIYMDWRDKFKEGVIYYLEKGRIIGILLWNVRGKVNSAREIIARQETYPPEKLKRLL